MQRKNAWSNQVKTAALTAWLTYDLHQLGRSVSAVVKSLRVCLKVALRGNHADEFIADIDVRLFQGAGINATSVRGGRRVPTWVHRTPVVPM